MTQAGQYYLWLKVTVDGKTIKQSYEPYSIKDHTTLVCAKSETSETSPFLGKSTVKRNKVKSVIIASDGDKLLANSNSSYLFANLEGGLDSETTITGLDNLDTQLVASMYCMFRGCSSLTNIDVSKFNTSKVETMYQMFRNCRNLVTIYASNKFLIKDGDYAKIDGGTSDPGYFTAKPVTANS